MMRQLDMNLMDEQHHTYLRKRLSQKAQQGGIWGDAGEDLSLGQSLNFSKLQFPHLKMEITNPTCKVVARSKGIP